MIYGQISLELSAIKARLCDQEWRLFKAWQQVCPNEPFEAYNKEGNDYPVGTKVRRGGYE